MSGSLAIPRPKGSTTLDLRRAPLAKLLRIDFRAASRDFWTDEAALWDRLIATWAGLDDAAWRLPGAAPSDAGGPDWSLLDHVGHLLDWYELADAYITTALSSGQWPTDDDYEGGDFDTFNEHRRELYSAIPPADIRARLETAHATVVETAGRLALATIYSDAAWGWVYSALHGHALDHLRVIEPWADRLRERQLQNDPFGDDPQPLVSNLEAAKARFWADDAAVSAQFDALLAGLPEEAWIAAEVTPGWTVADHVGHIAAWFDEAVAALEEHGRTGQWRELSAQAVDDWNEHQVRQSRGTPPSVLLDRYHLGRERLRRAVAGMADDIWLDPLGFSWAYEDLHGHLRTHLVMIAPLAARLGWPDA